MTLAKTGPASLSAITYAPHTVSAHKMEKFAELMVRSLEGKESNCPQ
jgi:hypothetical protein